MHESFAKELSGEKSNHWAFLENPLHFITFSTPSVEIADNTIKTAFRKCLKRIFNSPKTNIKTWNGNYLWISEKNPYLHFHMISDVYDDAIFREAYGRAINDFGFSMERKYLDAKPVTDFGIIDYVLKVKNGICMKTGEVHLPIIGRVWGGSRSMEFLKPELLEIENLPPQLFVEFSEKNLIKSEQYYSIYRNSPKAQEAISKHYRAKLYGLTY